MLTTDRQATIYDLVRRGGSVRNTELVERLNVSEMTIRRDLDELESRRLVRRVHGGAVFIEGSTGDAPFSVRTTLDVEKKIAIARVAIGLVPDGGSIALDGSSTAVELARLTKGLRNISVVTNSISVLLELRDIPEIRVMSLGGCIAADGNTMEGPIAVEQASRISVDVFFFSCAGFGPDGITNSTPVGTDVRKVLLHNAKTNVLLVDSTKYGRRAFIRFLDWKDCDVLITDDGIPDGGRKALSEVAPHLRVELAKANSLEGFV